MTLASASSNRNVEYSESSGQPGPAGPMRAGFAGIDGPDRIAELERENSRLQLLVAELLIKNQQLRKAD